MPLPGSTTLSLQGLPKPGDALYGKPKQAMIVRMTAEALEALEACRGNAAMDFEFGDTPGIHIGEAFFPMNATPDANHELYLRQTTVAKPNAPLKLYGNVSGKFMINPELGKAVEERVRDRTRVAEEQRTERKAILLETPPDLGRTAGTGKKKKEPMSSMFRKPLAGAADVARRNLSAASGSQATRGASPRVSATSASVQSTRHASPAASSSRLGVESDPTARGRLIHLLAARPGEQEDIILKRVAGGKPTDAKRASLLNLLEEVGMKSGDGGPRVWQLKPELYKTEVRPYEYQFSAAQADAIAKNAMTVFRRMRLPPNHQAWDNVRKPKDESRPATPAGAGDSARPEPKRAIVKDTKATKAKAADAPRKRKANEPIPMKDESVHAPASSKGKERSVDTPTLDKSTSSAGSTAMRRLPGSGFKARDSGSPPTRSRQGTPIGRVTSPAVSAPPSKRTGPVDARQSKRSMPPPSGSADPAPPIAPPAMQERKVSNSSITSKSGAQRKAEDERNASQTLAAKKAAREAERKQTLPANTNITRKFKKRAADDDDDYSDRDVLPQKRRRLAETKERERQREREHERERESDRDAHRGRARDSDLERGRGRMRDAPIPRKVKQEASPITVARVKVKKEASPATSFTRATTDRDAHARPPSRLSEMEIARPPSSSSGVSGAEPQRGSAHSRSRRKSPVYTSSEDESPPPVKVKTEAVHKDRMSKSSKPKYVPLFRQRSAPLPSDAEALQKYYRTCYRVYTTLNSQKTNFVMKYQDAVEDGEDDYVYVSDSDSDSPLELFDPDITAAFTADLMAVEEELRRIRMTYANMYSSGDSD